MKRSVVLLLTLALPAADLPREQAIKEETQKLKGTWAFVPPPGSTMREFVYWEFTSDTIRTTLLDDRGGFKLIATPSPEMTFSIDPTKDPKTMDLTVASGPNKGKTSGWIYLLDGDGMMIGMPRAVGGARPQKLERNEATSVIVFARSSPEKVKALMTSWQKNLDAAQAEQERDAQGEPSKPAVKPRPSRPAAPATESKPAPEQPAMDVSIIWYVIPVVCVALAVAFIWMRRGDRAVHSRLANVRARQFQPPEPAETPPQADEHAPPDPPADAPA